jgi:acetyl esterase/lipase
MQNGEPSVRARIAAPLVRWVVKRWAQGDPPAVVRRARRVFSSPDFLNFLYSHNLNIETVNGKVRGEWIVPRERHPADQILLYLHGGGYVSCSPRTHRPITTTLARLARCRVFSLDYRLAPEHKFPAAVDDATAAFLWLVESGVPAGKIALAGDSAGGGLAVATMLRLREQGHPLPAGAALTAPWIDLTCSASYKNSASCAMFEPPNLLCFAEMYLDGASPRLPEASPAFADLHGLPPLLIHVSDTELLMDDAVRLHHQAMQAGVASTLHIYSRLPHVWTVFAGILPEAGEALEEVSKFVCELMDGANNRSDHRATTELDLPVDRPYGELS